MATVEKTKKQQKKAGQATWFSRYPHLIVIAAFTFLLYANMLGNGYNMDDELVTINHRLTSQGISAIPEIFTSPYYQDNMGYAYEYRPIVLTTFAIEHQFFGESAFMGHVISLLLYIGLCIVLYQFLLLLGGVVTPSLALFITLLFSAFTAHTEVVCSIKNRDELLGLIFSLLAARYALLAARSDKWWLVLAVPFFYLLAILSKLTYLGFAPILVFAMVFFTASSFARVVLVSLALAVPSFFLITIDNLYDKVLITLAIPLFAVLCYVVKLFVELNLQEAYQKAKGYIRQQIQTTLTWLQSERPVWATKKQLFEAVAFPVSYWSWKAILPSLLLVGLYVHGYVFFSKPETILALILLAVLSFFAEQKMAWWANLVFYVLVGAYTSENFTPDIFTTITVHLVGGLILYGLFFGPRDRVLPTLVLATLFGVNHTFKIITMVGQSTSGLYSALTEFGLVYFCYTVIPFVYLFGKKKMGVMINVAVLLIIAAINIVIGQMEVNILAFAAALLFIFWWSTKNRKPHFLKVVLLLGLAFMLPVLQADPSRSERKEPVVEVAKTITEAGKTTNITIVPDKQDRPISYIELPISQSDPMTIRLGTSLVVAWHYFTKTILPYPLSFYYGYAYIIPQATTQPLPLLGLGVHLLLFLVAIYFIKSNRFVSFSIVIYLVTIAVFSNLVSPVPGIVADRYMLVSSLGWCMLLGYGLFYLVERYLAKKTITDWSSVSTPARILALLPLVIYSSLTFSRNFHWKDHLTLMRKDVQYVTNSAQAHNLLALNIMKSTTEGQKTQAELDALRQEALGHFKQSFAIYPNTFNVAYDIGRVYSAMNNPDSMMVYFQKAADLDPDHQLPELSYTLAVYHQETKKYDYAIIQLQKLLKLQNTNLEAYSRLSYIHFTLGQYDQALATNRTAAFNLPTRPEPFINMAYTFQGMKNLDSMTYYFNLAEQRFPGHPVVLQAKRNLNNQ